MSLDNLTKRDMALIQRGFKRIVDSTLNKGIPVVYYSATRGAIVRNTRVNGVDSIEIVKIIYPPSNDPVAAAQIEWRGW